MKYFSLFSGIGGFELGIQQAYENNQREHIGSESEQKERPQRRVRNLGKRELQLCPADRSAPFCVGFSEIDKYAIKIYEQHFPFHKGYGDITRISEQSLPDFDLICGGFPCQSFSIAGKRRGFEDTRGTLFFDIARIINHKRPRLVFLENVKGLLNHDGGRTFATILCVLDGMGYDLQWQVLNSKNFGVPQNRERVFIIGHLRGTARPEVFPITPDSQADIVIPTLTSRYYGAQANGGYIRNKPTQVNQPKHSNDRVYTDIGISPTLNTMQGGRRQPKVMRQPLRYLDRNQKNIEGDYAFTVDASSTSGIKIDENVRRLTPLECERLQGFPDHWTNFVSDTQRYKCLGNAVTVNVIKCIAEKLC